MTISIQANAAGTAAQINIGATPVVNLPVTSGLPFCKNKLFNGEVTRINQRAFDGNWTPKNTWNAGNTIAQQELCYGYDMWAKASATNMVQLIEAGNFRPSTVHTLSGIGVTTQQITSPASGNWTITVLQTARNVQVEEGAVATPFEMRPIGFELAQCQRYYQPVGLAAGQSSNTTWSASGMIGQMRVVPAATTTWVTFIDGIGALSTVVAADYTHTSDNYMRVAGTNAAAGALGNRGIARSTLSAVI